MAFFFRAEENGGEKNIKKKKKKKSENEKEIPRNREIPSTWGRTPGPRCGASLPQLSKKKEEEEKGTKKKEKKRYSRRYYDGKLDFYLFLGPHSHWCISFLKENEIHTRFFGKIWK